jgi:hypothetical protein
VNGLFRWIVAVSSAAQLVGGALILWGLKVVPVSNPFTPFVRDSTEPSVRVPGRAEREHPWAVASGAVLFIVGLALLVVAGVVRP